MSNCRCGPWCIAAGETRKRQRAESERDALRSERDAAVARAEAAEATIRGVLEAVDEVPARDFVMYEPGQSGPIKRQALLSMLLLEALQTRRVNSAGLLGRSPESEEMERLYGKAGCLLSGPGRGDCAHFVGMPTVLDASTTDCYGRPIGWCYPCWADHLIQERDDTIATLRTRSEARERALVEAARELIASVDDLGEFQSGPTQAQYDRQIAALDGLRVAARAAADGEG